MVTMLKSKVDLILLAIFLAASSALMAISWPLPREKTQLTVPAGRIENDEVLQAELPFENFVIIIDYPHVIRTHEQTQASFMITPDQWIVEDVSENPGLMVETRVDLAGVQLDPSGIVSQPLTSSGGLSFSWCLEADQPGIYKGTLWIFLNDTGEGTIWPILARSVEIRAQEILPVTPAILRWVFGMVCSLVIILLALRMKFTKSP